MKAVHCICHCLALASGQASNQVKYLNERKQHLLTLWKYFHFSAVRSAQLRSMQDVMDSPELKIVKEVHTHWLSHKTAIAVLLHSLSAILVMLQQQTDPILLNEVLSAINRLSLTFQQSAIDLTIVSPLLKSTIQTLDNLEQESAAVFENKEKTKLIALTI